MSRVTKKKRLHVQIYAFCIKSKILIKHLSGSESHV